MTDPLQPPRPDRAALIEAEIDRVLTQYRESPKLLHMTRTYLGQVADVMSLIASIPDYFWLDSARGEQLTYLGKRLGWLRHHCVCVTAPVFGLSCDTGTSAPGISPGTSFPEVLNVMISGTAPKVGDTLTVDVTSTGSPTPTLSYQWKRNLANIPGATAPSYTVVEADVGMKLRCLVTATSPVGEATGESPETDPVGVPPTGSLTLHYVGSGSGTTSASLPTHKAGDLILIFAYCDGSAVAPSLPAGFTEARSSTAPASSYRIGWKIAASNGETSGTWTGATSVIAHVYRGAHPTAPIGAATGASGQSGVYFPELALNDSSGKSWVALFAGETATDTALETTIAGYTRRVTLVDATDEVVSHDSNGGATSFAGLAFAEGGSAGEYLTAVIEIVSAGGTVPPDSQIPVVLAFDAATSAAAATASLPAHQTGDLILAFAFADGSATPPALPSGWTSLRTSATASAALRVAYKLAASASEDPGTWTGATSVAFAVYSGVDQTNPVGTVDGATGASGVFWPAATFAVGDGTSWCALYAAHTSQDTTTEQTISGFTRRLTSAAGVQEIVLHDSAAGLTGFAGQAITEGGTAGQYHTAVIEIRKGGTTTVPPPSTAPLTARTTQIVSTSAGQIIENYDLDYSGSDYAIVLNHPNVILRHCRIKYRNNNGVQVWSGASGFLIQDCEIIQANAPTGINPSPDQNRRCINIEGVTGGRVEDCSFKGGSMAVYVLTSSQVHIKRVEHYNARGAVTGAGRGNMVQFNQSNNCSLSDFYSINPIFDSYTEDNISIGQCQNISVSNGLVIGNNGPSGWGTMIEMNSTGVVVSDVDYVNQGCGAVHSSSPGAKVIRCRNFDGYWKTIPWAGNVAPPRGVPTTDCLQFGATASSIEFWDCWYARPGNAGQYLMYESNVTVNQITRNDALQPKPKPVNVKHSWNA